MTSGLRTKDINELLGLFEQLEKLLNPELPAKNTELWEQSLEQAKKGLAEQLTKRQSGFTLRPGPNIQLRKTRRTRQNKIQRQYEKRIHQIAEKEYCKKDLTYAKAVEQSKSKAVDVSKSIDHLLLAVREPLLHFPRVKDSLLAVDWKRNIRDYYRFLNKDDFSCQVQEAIDVLEALKLQFERQQPKEVEPQQREETKQSAALGKWKKIWACVKRIPRRIYVLVIFLAALLTCIYLLWWLWMKFSF